MTFAIEDWVDDQRMKPYMQNHVPCPEPMLIVQLADRFHLWPGDITRKPARDVIYWTRILSAEATARSDSAGLTDEQDMIREYRIDETGKMWEPQIHQFAD